MFSDVSFGGIVLGSLALAAIYTLVCWAWGRMAIRAPSAGVSEWATAFALGHAALGIVLQFIAVAGHFYWYALVPLSLAAAWAFRFRNGIRTSWENLQEAWSGRSGLTRLTAFLVGGLCLLLLVDTVSYPGTDALAYYLAQPKLIAATGRYVPLTGFETFSVLPAIGEMQYAAMYALGGETMGQLAGKLSIWPVFMAILTLLWQIGRRLGLSIDAAWMVVVFGATSSAVTLVVWDGKTDLVGLMYALAALRFLPGLLSPGIDRRGLLLFGGMAACALMAKLSYALVLPFVLGTPLLLWRNNPRDLLRIVGWAGLAALIALSMGWWAKNFLLHGDPFAPILNLSPGTPRFNLGQVWFDAENTGWIVRTYPLALTFGQYPMQHGGVSPLWLVLLPALWSRPWQSEGGQKAALLAVGGMLAVVAWGVLRPSVIAPRYFFPALLWPCFLLAFGFDRWLAERKPLAAIAQWATVVLLALNIQYALTVARYMAGPYVRALTGKAGVLPLRDRAVRLAEASRAAPLSCLLLSYSSEPLPMSLLTGFRVSSRIPRSENVFDWVSRENVYCIVYDPITHKRDELEGLPPDGSQMEKIEFLPKTYYLFLPRTKASPSPADSD